MHKSGFAGERVNGFEQDDTQGRIGDRNSDGISVCDISGNQFSHEQFLCLSIFADRVYHDGGSIGGRIALVAWCVYFLPVGILSFLHFRKR